MAGIWDEAVEAGLRLRGAGRPVAQGLEALSTPLAGRVAKSVETAAQKPVEAATIPDALKNIKGPQQAVPTEIGVPVFEGIKPLSVVDEVEPVPTTFKTTPVVQAIPDKSGSPESVLVALKSTFTESLKQIGFDTPTVELRNAGVSYGFRKFEVAAPSIRRSDEAIRKEAEAKARLVAERTGEDVDAVIEKEYQRILSTEEMHKGEPVATILFNPDTKEFKMDIGMDGKNIRGTGEGTAMYNALYSTAAAMGGTVKASSMLTAGNSVLKNVNVASGIYKLGRSDVVDANVQQFAPLTGGGLSPAGYADLNSAVTDAVELTSRRGASYGVIDGQMLVSWKADKNTKYYYSDDIIERAEETIGEYRKYWNPDADGSDAKVTYARTNNLLAVFFKGLEDGVASREGRPLGSEVHRKAAEEIRNRLGGNASVFKKALVEVGAAVDSYPLLKVLKDMMQEPKWQKILPGIIGATLAESLMREEGGTSSDDSGA